MVRTAGKGESTGSPGGRPERLSSGLGHREHIRTPGSQATLNAGRIGRYYVRLHNELEHVASTGGLVAAFR
jgi:hypothetical protein